MRGALGRRHPLGTGLARFVCTLTALLLVTNRGHAQSTAESLNLAAPGHDHLRGRVTMDPALMFGLGYVRSFDLPTKRKLTAHVDLEALLDFSSWSLTTGASARLLDRPGFDVLGSLQLDLSLAENEVHTALAYGYRAGVFPGYYRPQWYIAAEMSLRGSLAATLWNKDEYLSQVPDAQNGTYWTGVTYLSLGAVAGVRVFTRYFFGLRAAYRMPTTFQSYGPWIQPMTVGVEMGGTFEWF